MINGRAKGAAGEREFCDWLFENLKLDEKPARNLEQTRQGGHDVLVENFIFEVKRCEGLALKHWWLQVCVAKDGLRLDDYTEYHTVVAFRQNKQPWRFLISAKWLGLQTGFIQLEERSFLLWLKNKLQENK